MTTRLQEVQSVLKKKIDVRKLTEQSLSCRLDFEKVISQISSNFVGLYELDASINSALAAIGRLSGASRACIFLTNKAGTFMDNTHEWCAEGVVPYIHELKNIPFANFPWLMSKLEKGEIIAAMDIMEDITERKKAEDALRQSERQLPTRRCAWSF